MVTPTMRSLSGFMLQRMASCPKQEIPRGFCCLLFLPVTGPCLYSFGGEGQAVSGQVPEEAYLLEEPKMVLWRDALALLPRCF